MRRSFISFIIFIISGAALSAQSGDRDLRLTMKNQGYEREYRLYIPEGVGEGSPLVIALHGYGGGIEKMPSALITTAMPSASPRASRTLPESPDGMSATRPRKG